MRRYCPNCGTEVDETALFCPTCGNPIDEDGAEAEIPPAPAWPDPAPTARDEPSGDPSPEVTGRSVGADRPADPARAEAASVARSSEPERHEPPHADDDREIVGQSDGPTRVQQRPPQPSTPPAPPAERRSSPSVELPITMPVTMSGWLIGVGATLAAIGILVSLFDGFLNPIELLLFLALLGIAATVFLSARLPAVPHLQLTTLVIVLIGFGIALDRIGFGGAGIGELLLFLGTAAAAIGAIILELGRDQPMGGPGAG